MNINFEIWKTYKECPKKYFLQYRKQLPPTKPQNDYFKLYDLLVKKFFQNFSNIWRYKTPFMWPEFIRKKLNIIYEQLLETLTIDWAGPFVKLSKNEFFENAFEDIRKIMDSHNQNYFLNTRADIEIEVKTKEGHKISDSIDFIHTDAFNNNETIIDGKDSKKVKKRINNDQLFFHALLYYFHYKKIPTQSAFFYYRHNLIAPQSFDNEVFNKYRTNISKDIKDIVTSSSFEATPSTKACKHCLYSNSCAERSKWQTMHRNSKTDLFSAEGVINFGF